MRKLLIAAAIAALSAPALAQTAAVPSAGSPDKAALSKSCSQQADAKGLHGKARKHFRNACKHGH